MQPDWNILNSVFHCHYKTWLLTKEVSNQTEQIEQSNNYQNLNPKLDFDNNIVLPLNKITANDRLIAMALCLTKAEAINSPIESAKIHYEYRTSDLSKTFPLKTTNINIFKYGTQAQKLLNDFKTITNKNEPPAFYRNKHCPECQFWDACHKKLIERDDISLLGSISPKVLSRYHNKGISSIIQLSHTFRPRRRRVHFKSSGTYLWELKALAIREKKTFVLQPPVFTDSSKCIYIDFEGIPDEGFVYLLGGIIREEGRPDEAFSFWADGKEGEKEIFGKLLVQLKQHPEAQIYHYGSYETKAIRKIAKKWGGAFKSEISKVEKRMVNLLGYLRNNVYPPTYTNGLKEVGGMLGFHWSNSESDGKHSIEWRKNWEITDDSSWKERLLQYNLEDCLALIAVKEWLKRLATDTDRDDVQQVMQMKKVSPYKFQNNPEFGADYQYINKTAYFDYQRTKIYWRNKKNKSRAKAFLKRQKAKHPGKGVTAFMPKIVDEVVVAVPLKECPHCGGRKLYYLNKRIYTARQTDLKFTSSGIKRWVTEYQSTQVKCAACNMKSNNKTVRMLHYGDNLFAWAINLYVRYHISHYMISDLIQEQFGIWTNPMYLIQRKHKWWKKRKQEVDYLWKIIRNSPVIHIDETNIKLSRDRGYVWAFATPDTVFYHFTLTRETEFLRQWLKDYKGVIVTDFFPGYEALPVKQQRCLVHLIRDLNDDLFKNPFDEEYKIMVESFGKLLRRIIETIDRHGLRKIHLQKHQKDVQNFYDRFIESSHTSELSVKYAKRLRKHWEELWTFLRYDDLPWNNNNAEAAIKAFAQHRRGVNGQVNEKGIKQYLEMLSIAQTCRYRNISFLDFLRHKSGIWENVQFEMLPDFLPFSQARLYVQKLGFQRKQEWNKWKESGKRPAFIPSSPEKTYKKDGWINWHDWIGFDFLPFKEARTYMRRLGLRNRDEYWAWLRKRKRPKFIPYSPEKVYKGAGWKNLGDWLGTGNLGRQKKAKLSYEQTKAYVQTLGLKTQKEFVEWRKRGQRPETIPANPYGTYGNEFEGWGKFFGTDRIANQNKEYWSYNEAKAFLKPLNILSLRHFRELYTIGAISVKIPKNPWAYYKKEGTWVNYSDLWGKTPNLK